MTPASLHMRLGTGEGERDRIRAFVATLPDQQIHALDLPYRLTSPSYATSDVAVWETDERELAAFAVWQPPFKIVDYGMNPACDADRLGDGLIDWIESSFTERVRRTHAPATCWINVAAANRELVPRLERRGFERCAWSIVHLERTVDGCVSSELPPGFSIEGGREVSAEAWAVLHRAVLPRVGMSADWRRGIMASAGFRPDLDAVVVGAGRAPVAFCTLWVGELSGEKVAKIEPLGTHPDCRGKRLGRALVAELVQRLTADGVARVVVEPWDDNQLAVYAYQSLGFKPTFTIPTFARHFS